ncbi:MAG: hypothetical protein V1799_07455 [bacterium]
MPNLLPVGFTYQGVDYRTFEVNLIDGFIERIIHNQMLRSEKPQTWVAMVVSGLLHTIGDNVVSSDFVESDGKKIPPIVKNIPIVDAGLILVKGHINTYGSELKNQKTKCLHCGRPNVSDLDLNQMPIPTVDLNVPIQSEIVVKLPRGWKRQLDPEKRNQKELGWEDKVFDTFVFGIPSLGDALRNENLSTTSRVLDFQAKIVNDRLKRVVCSKDKFEMPSEMFEAYQAGNIFFADRGGLIANDRMAIRDALNKLPQISLQAPVTCNNCKQDYDASVDYASFFPLVS